MIIFQIYPQIRDQWLIQMPISAKLQKFKKFKDHLPLVSQVKRTPHPVAEGDAISALYDICVQRKCPLPM